MRPIVYVAGDLAVLACLKIWFRSNIEVIQWINLLLSAPATRLHPNHLNRQLYPIQSHAMVQMRRIQDSIQSDIEFGLVHPKLKVMYNRKSLNCWPLLSQFQPEAIGHEYTTAIKNDVGEGFLCLRTGWRFFSVYGKAGCLCSHLVLQPSSPGRQPIAPIGLQRKPSMTKLRLP